mmetsp:Transcript_589/g.1965  ORF Transcript_589/g.1965 Transcript_589/m.1965 type:complete len:172 (+) Transcript_589:152-667(+)
MAARAPPAEHSDLTELILKTESFALNSASDHPMENLWLGDDRLTLQSDADEQLIISISFRVTTKLHSLRIKSPDAESAPTRISLFANSVGGLDFNDVTEHPPTQEIELDPEEVAQGVTVPLRFVKFQNTNNVTIFVAENGGAETTSISLLRFIGKGQDFCDVSTIHERKEG